MKIYNGVIEKNLQPFVYIFIIFGGTRKLFQKNKTLIYEFHKSNLSSFLNLPSCDTDSSINVKEQNVIVSVYEIRNILFITF